MTEQLRNSDVGVHVNGGRFAAFKQDAPTNAELPADDRAHNAQGSFYYPPAARNPHQFVDFWSNVPISDEALARFERTYDQRLTQAAMPAYRRRIDKYVEDKMAAFLQKQEDSRETEAFKLKWEAATRESRERQLVADARNIELARQELMEEAPLKVAPPDYTEVDPSRLPYPEIGKSSIRPLARAAAMHAYLPGRDVWSETDREAVLEHPIDLGYNNIKTVREIEHEYKLSELTDFLYAQ